MESGIRNMKGEQAMSESRRCQAMANYCRKQMDVDRANQDHWRVRWIHWLRRTNKEIRNA